VVAYQTIIVENCSVRQADHQSRDKTTRQSENKFTLQLLGVVAEYEHAKIIERTSRGGSTACAWAS